MGLLRAEHDWAINTFILCEIKGQYLKFSECSKKLDWLIWLIKILHGVIQGRECYWVNPVQGKPNNLECHTEWSKSDREGETSHDIPYMQNIKRNDTNETYIQDRNRLKESQKILWLDILALFFSRRGWVSGFIQILKRVHMTPQRSSMLITDMTRPPSLLSNHTSSLGFKL